MGKVCNICLKEKELIDFYPNRGMKDGYQNRCIECTKIKTREREERLSNDPEWVEKNRQRHREKYYRLQYKDKHKPTPEEKKIAIAKHKSKFPEKVKAKNLSNHLKAKVRGNHLHHWNYNIEFAKDVIELSILQHNKAHRYMIYDQERFMYRRVDTMELLDTREKHEDFIFNVIKDKL